MDPVALSAWVRTTAAAPAPADPVAERRHRTDLGVAARLSGDLELAEKELSQALQLALSESPSAAVRTRARLALVRQWRGCYAEAAGIWTRASRRPSRLPTGRSRTSTPARAPTTSATTTARRRISSRHWACACSTARTRPWSRRPGKALDAADACRTAIAVAAELDRLVPGGHHRIRDTLRGLHLLPERPPNFGALVELRGILLMGRGPHSVVAAPVPLPPGDRRRDRRARRGRLAGQDRRRCDRRHRGARRCWTCC